MTLRARSLPARWSQAVRREPSSETLPCGWSFYLGRLSGRDDKTFWAMVIKGRLAELRENPKAKELLYGKCMEFYTAKMTDRMTE